MAWWLVAFRPSPDAEPQTTFVDAPKSLATEAEVWDALERGSIPGSYFRPGTIISVDPVRGTDSSGLWPHSR